MSKDRDQFWKDLLGEVPEELRDKKESPAPKKPEFTVEYLNQDGRVIGRKEQPAPKPAGQQTPQPQTRRTEPVLRSERTSEPTRQTPVQRPAQPVQPQRPVQRPAQRPAPQQQTPAQRPAQPAQPQRPIQQPGQRTAPRQQTPTQRPAQPAQPQKPAQQPVQRPVPQQQTPAQQPVQRPAPQQQTPVRRPAQPVQPQKPAQRPATPAPVPPAKSKKPRYDDDRSTGDANIEVDFDFDGEYEDADEKILRRGRTRRRGCLEGILYFLFIMSVSIALACFGWAAATDVLGLGKPDSTVNVTVPRAWFSTETREDEQEDGTIKVSTVSVADIEQVTDMLYDQGLIKYKWIFKLFASFANADEKISAGTYILNTNFDYRALVYGMNPRSGERVSIDVTIPEGYTVRQIVSLLQDKGVCDADLMWEELKNGDFSEYDFLPAGGIGDERRLEGYLFPDTYTFYMGDTPSRVLGKMLKNFDRKWTDELQAKADDKGLTLEEILIVASMIEKEAGADSERATIASVIYNRLNNPDRTGGLLQIDATIYYAIAGTDKEFSKSLDDPYNTYLYPGLVPGPIANPGMASIKAALEPESTRYYYYALGKDKLHRFFTNYEDHQAFVNSAEYGG